MHSGNFVRSWKVSKRNKKYNPAKTARVFSSKGLDNLGVFYDYRSEGKYPFELVNLKSFNPVKLTDVLSYTLKESKHNWTIVLISTGLDSEGEQSYCYGFASNGTYCYQRDLVEELRIKHREFAYNNDEIAEIQNHCWLAIPNIERCPKVDDQTIFNLLNKYGAW